MYKSKQQIKNRRCVTRSQKSLKAAKEHFMLWFSVYGFICYLIVIHQK